MSRIAWGRMAVLAIAVGVSLFAPVTAAAATSDVPNASSPRSGGAVAPVGQVQATLLTSGPQQKTSGPQPPPFRTMNPAALRTARPKAAAASPGPAGALPNTLTPKSAALFNGLNSPGLSAADEGDQPTPPDSTGAIGPTRYV